jgi:hypothetical protein
MAPEELLQRKIALDARVAETPGLAQTLRELRAWQAARLARTYDDLHKDNRYGAAVGFFLNELYGPQDFTRRDSDFRRAWKYFKRALPDAALQVLQRTLALQVLSEELDQAMAGRLAAGPVTSASYSAAYRSVGRPEARREQIDLLIAIGEDLERLVRHTWITLALRAAHAPANAAGFGALQDFLERGFAAFRRMKSAQRLLAAIRQRETLLMEALFNGNADPSEWVDAKDADLP